ncbi:MAG: winged helix-turn-helix domain-containing protein [Candidatus Hodarchaeota archaeon]
MVKKEEKIRKYILELLEKSKFGISIKKIAEETNFSRITVTKYLKKLEKEGLVSDRRVGQYKIWYLSDFKKYNQSYKLQAQSGVLEYQKSLMKYLKIFHPEINGKKIGREIAKEHPVVKDVIPVNETKKTLNIITDLNQFASIVIDLIKIIYLTNDPCSIDPPIINQDPPFIIIRIRDSNFMENKLHFEIFSGIIEQETLDFLNSYPKIFEKLFTIEVNVFQFLPEEKIVDLKYEIKPL